MTPNPALAFPEPVVYENAGFPREALDEDAVKIVQRLRRKGFEAFFVGGCVRDLLLHREPKDFDIATSARPRQIKQLFRNSRIIGRRFKLAHLHFDGKIIEVSTYRRPPEQDDDSEDLLITSDNAFGTAEEDARRRDFTCNGLFYCPDTDRIHDFVGGVPDIEKRLVRTIGEPDVRIQEDPVRILRAVKFASRLNLRIGKQTWKAMCDNVGDLQKGAAPRILEEIVRLLRSAKAARALQLLRECGALQVLLPEVSRFLEQAPVDERLRFWRLLEALDALVQQYRFLEASNVASRPATPVLLGALFQVLIEDKAQIFGRRKSDLDFGRQVESFISPILKRMNVSRAESGTLKRILVVQRRFQKDGRARGFKPSSFAQQYYFPDALQLLELRCMAGQADWSEYDRWEERHLGHRRGPTIADRAASANGAAEPNGTHAPELAHGNTAAEVPEPRSEERRRDRGRDRDRGGRGREDRGRGQEGRREPAERGRGQDGRKATPERERGQDGRKAPAGRERGQDGRRAAAERDVGEDRSRRRKRRRGKDRGEQRQDEVPSELVASLPAIELDPRHIPSYGSVLGDTGSQAKIQLETSKGKRTRKREAKLDEPYVPPPPPEESLPVIGREPEDDDDTFGDW